MKRLIGLSYLFLYATLFAQSISVPGEVLVKVKPNLAVSGLGLAKSAKNIITSSNSELNASLSALSASAMDKVFVNSTNSPEGLERWYKINFPASMTIDQAIQVLRSNSDIEYIEPNYISTISVTPNDLRFGSQWGLSKIGMQQAWELEKGNINIRIAVLDVGFKLNHVDLQSKFSTTYQRDETDIDTSYWINRGYTLISGEDYIIADNDPTGKGTHGTHVAGIAAATTNNSIGIAGVAWNNQIVPVRCGFFAIHNGEYKGLLETDDWLRALNWVITNNAARVVNMSFSRSGGSSTIEKDVINSALAAGITLCASSGNSNLANVGYPAAYPGVIAVGATNSNDNRCSPTDWGPDHGSNYGTQLSLVAPGNSILSTYFDASGNSTYYSQNGTSMATPFVAGAVALILSRNPNFTPSEIKSILISSATKVPAMGGQNFTNEYGYGLLNVYEAIHSFGLVTPSQKDVNNSSIGEMHRWAGSSFISVPLDQFYPVPFNSIEVLKGDQSVRSNQKYLQWENTKTGTIEPEVINHHSFLANEDLSVTSKFTNAYSASLKTTMDGIDFPNGSVQFRDPWLIDYNDPVYGNEPRNRGMADAVWTTVPSASGNLSVSSNFKGVFKNLDPNLPGVNNYYKIQAASSANFSGQEVYFQSWGVDGIATLTNYYSGAEQPVVFKYNDAVITANYKGHLRANTLSTAHSTNQRRVVKSGNTWLMVYESNNQIWMTLSTDNGVTWSKDEFVDPSPGDQRWDFGYGINPTISNVVNGRVVIGWVEMGVSQPEDYGVVTFITVTMALTPEGKIQRGWAPVKYLYPDLKPSYLQYVAFEPPTPTPYGFLDTKISIVAKPDGLIRFAYNVTPYFDYWQNGMALGDMNASSTKDIGENGIGWPADIAPGKVTSSPVLVYYPAAFGQPEIEKLYYISSGYASGTRIVEYNIKTNSSALMAVPAGDYSYLSLSGAVNPTSASYAITATAISTSQSGTFYNTNIYSKGTYSGSSMPSLTKVYSNTQNSVLMVQNTSSYGAPVYEVNFSQGANWYKADGGASITQIGSAVSGIFTREQVGANDRKSIFVKNNFSPAKLVVYSGSGVLNKGESVLYADVRSVRNFTTNDGLSKMIILDFSGASVEPVDSLESGSVICAVKLSSLSENSVIVRQPDSIKTSLAIDVIRNGLAVRSYEAGVWDELSINSFDEIRDGDILIFRFGFPIVSSSGYEIYDFNGTSLAKNEEPFKTETKLKVIDNIVSVYPNPFNPSTNISVSLASPALVKVIVYNFLGQQVIDFGNADLGAGVHNFTFDGRNLASGTYIYRALIGESIITGKLQLLK